LQFPQGLGKIMKKGKRQEQTATFNVSIRKAGTATVIAKPAISITNRKFAGFYRAVRIDFPERGAWEVQITRTSISEPRDDWDDSFALTCTWVVLQTFRPEYPFNTSTPLCLTAMRVKATHQMNGQVQTYNCMTRRVTDGFGQSWPTNIPRNPAISALYTLMGPGLCKPEPASRINWAAFAEWREFCTSKGLKFDLVIGN
ncbi:hypothetical protein, partial [Acidovorax sp. ST3]|uniref:TipJ family phage tail tip protein n=1 Tax=Acidovorax sp. ST3 TaxID=2219062 RepID=UPI00193D49C8